MTMQNQEQIVNIRTQQINDGRKAVLGDIQGGATVFFGYIDADVHLQIGGSDRVAKRLVQ